jgi:MYXO-CTERM domain-containing protein
MRRVGFGAWVLVAAALGSACGGAPEPGEAVATTSAAYSAPVSGCNQAAIRAAAPASAQGMLDRAYSWVNAGIMYCECVVSGTSGYRADCSGFVSYIWSLPAPGDTTYDFPGGPWNDGRATAISWSDLTIGDALNFGGNVSAGTGHVMLFGGWLDSGHTQFCSIEESSTGTPAHIGQHSLGDPGSWWGGSGTFQSIFQPIRKTGYVPTPPNSPPTGYLDSAGCTAVQGWTQDPDAPTANIHADIYFNGPAGSSGAIGIRTTANVSRSDLCGPLGSCDHGFDLAPPRGLLDGQPHSVYAYGIDSAGGPNTLLTNSPKTLNCPPPAAPLSPAEGVKRWVTDPTAFSAWNFSYTDDVAHYPDSTVSAYPDGPSWPATPTVVQADDGSPAIWVIDGSVRRHVINPASLAAWRFTSVQKWPAAQVDSYPQAVDFRPSPFLVMGSGPAVYVLDDPLTPPSTGAGGAAGAGGTGAAGAGGSSNAGAGGNGDAGWLPGEPEDAGTPGSSTEHSRTLDNASGSCSVGGGDAPADGTPLWLVAGVLVGFAARRRRRARASE